MARRPTAADWLCLTALVVFWGSSFSLTTIALEAVSPVAVVGGRVAIGAAVLLVLMRVTSGRLPSTLGEWRLLLIFALLGNIIPFHLIAWAQQHLESGTTAVLIAVVPLLVITLAHFVLPGERLTMPRIVGFGAGFAGVITLVAPQSIVDSGAPQTAFVAILAVLGAAASYAVNIVLVQLRARLEPLAAASGTLLVSSSIAIPVAALDGGAVPAPVTAHAVAAVVALGLLSTGAGSVLYFHVIRSAGPTFLSLINYLIPVWAVLVGIIWLDESADLRTWVGLGFVLAGVAVSQWRPSVKRSVERAGETAVGVGGPTQPGTNTLTALRTADVRVD